MSETESDKPEKFSMIEGEETEFPDCEKDTPDECSEHLNSKKKTAVDKEKKAKKSCLEIMFEPFLTLAGGWKTYAKQSVLFAGISLALLYMTVMGFDSITLGKCTDIKCTMTIGNLILLLEDCVSISL